MIPLSEPLSPDEEAVCSRLVRRATRGDHSPTGGQVCMHTSVCVCECACACACACMCVHMHVCGGWSADNGEETEQIYMYLYLNETCTYVLKLIEPQLSTYSFVNVYAYTHVLYIVHVAS